jgi:hypothetical protein
MNIKCLIFGHRVNEKCQCTRPGCAWYVHDLDSADTCRRCGATYARKPYKPHEHDFSQRCKCTGCIVERHDWNLDTLDYDNYYRCRRCGLLNVVMRDSGWPEKQLALAPEEVACELRQLRELCYPPDYEFYGSLARYAAVVHHELKVRGLLRTDESDVA